MKILQVVHKFVPNVTGGVVNYTYALCRELSKRHAIHLLYSSRDLSKNQHLVEEGIYQGLPYTEIINNNLESSYRNNVLDEIFIALIDRVLPDVIHIQHLKFLSANFVNLAKERGIPVVFTLHDFWLMCLRDTRMMSDMTICSGPAEIKCASCILGTALTASNVDRATSQVVGSITRTCSAKGVARLRKIKACVPERFVAAYQTMNRLLKSKKKDEIVRYVKNRNAYLKEICSAIDLFTVPSHFLRNEFIDFGIPKEKIIFSSLGFSGGWAADVKKKNTTKLRFGFVGTVSEHKGVHVLIKAFNRVKEKDVEVNIFGSQDVNRRYVKKIKSLIKNPAIRLRGKFDHQDISKIYSEIDILVLPSICFENSPLAIQEALMAGIPVITSDMGGMAELVQDGRNGLLFKTGDPDDLYAKVKMNIDDRQLANKLAAGIKPVKTIEQDARDFEERYLSLGPVNTT